MNIVKLAYFDEFQCTNSECPDSCCKDSWNIWLSRREYLDFKKRDMKPEFREIADKCIKRVKSTDDDYKYAQILHTDEGCSFLTENGLCTLHKELGEKALGYVCRTFPRHYASIGDDAVAMSCTSTCYHVNELLMRHPEGLAITEEEYKQNAKTVFSSFTVRKNWEGYPYYWDILGAEIDILQNRSFTISERLLILGYFCQKADEYMKNGSANKIPSLAAMLLDNDLCRKIADSLKPAVPQSDSSMTDSVSILLNMSARIKKTNMASYIKMIDHVLQKTGCTIKEVTEASEKWEVTADFSKEAILKLYNVYRHIEDERSYIIENLLVNIVFSQDMQDGIWKNYFITAVFYNMLRIIAPAFLNEEYSDRELALALTYAVKIVINTYSAEMGTFEDYVKDNKCTLPYAALLIC